MKTLPALPLPRHEAEIPGIPGVIRYTPYTMADKRNLLSALSFQNPVSFILTVVDIVERHSNLRELGAMQLHFIEAVFMKIYAASQGGFIEAVYTCPAEVEATDEDGVAYKNICAHETPIKIPIDDIGIDWGALKPGVSTTVTLSPDVAIVLRVPEWEVMRGFIDEDNNVDVSDAFVLECFDSVVNGDEVLGKADFTKEELRDWIEGMDSRFSDQIGEFFANIPIISKNLSVACPKCGAKRVIEMRGVADFFV